MPIRRHDKVIWAAHLLVDGARPAGSERQVDLADDYATSTTQIPAVSYAAFGHIHLAQELPGMITGRYAGGMLPFRFDEARAGAVAKTVVLVELPATGAAKMNLAPLATGRRLRRDHRTLEDLPARAAELEGASCVSPSPSTGPCRAWRCRWRTRSPVPSSSRPSREIDDGGEGQGEEGG